MSNAASLAVNLSFTLSDDDVETICAHAYVGCTIIGTVLIEPNGMGTGWRLRLEQRDEVIASADTLNEAIRLGDCFLMGFMIGHEEGREYDATQKREQYRKYAESRRTNRNKRRRDRTTPVPSER